MKTFTQETGCADGMDRWILHPLSGTQTCDKQPVKLNRVWDMNDGAKFDLFTLIFLLSSRYEQTHTEHQSGGGWCLQTSWGRWRECRGGGQKRPQRRERWPRPSTEDSWFLKWKNKEQRWEEVEDLADAGIFFKGLKQRSLILSEAVQPAAYAFYKTTTILKIQQRLTRGWAVI